MKKLFVFIVPLFLMLSLAGGVLSQDIELPSPGVTSDSFFYFFEVIFEKISIFFTFGDLKKAERYANLASERIAEAKIVVERGKSKATQVALERYEKQLGKAMSKIEEAKNKGKNIDEVIETLAEATSLHFIVLEEVAEKVPEQAEEAVARAWEKSKEGHIDSLKSLSERRRERAVEIDIESVRGRLERAKLESLKKNREGLSKTLRDYEDFEALLERVRGKDDTLAILVSEARVRYVEDLDKVEDGAQKIAPEIAGVVQEVRERTIKNLMFSLKDVAQEDPVKAAEINLQAIEGRLQRIKTKAEEQEVEEMEKAIEEFKDQYEFGEKISGSAQRLRQDVTALEQVVGKATSLHLEILSEVYGTVPEVAKEVIEEAMENPLKSHEMAVEVLKEKRALIEEIPEELPIPEAIPLEVQEKIQERVQKQIEIESPVK